LLQRVKYVRLLRQRASSPQARGADCRGFVYAVQLILEGHPLQKPKNRPGKGAVGLDLGPSTLAIVPEVGPARLLLLAEELVPDARTRRQLQRHLERERRANNPEHYDAQGRIKNRRTGAACMATWPTRSSAWAMICGSRKSATRAGNAALAEAWGCVPLGAL